jgi:hypothetical protein
MARDRILDLAWWEDDPVLERHEQVMQHVSALEEAQSYQHELNLRNARLYSNCDLLGLDWGLRGRSYSRKAMGKVTENIIQSACDTATSMIAQRQARATVQTDGGNFSLQQRAKKLEMFLDGTFESLDFHDKAVDMFRDAVVFGTGFIKIFGDRKVGKICAERVIPDEIKVDELEARAQDPRSMFQVKYVDRWQLAKMFPKHEKEIFEAGKESLGSHPVSRSGGLDPNTVLVVQAWHLPSGPGAKDGREAIVIEGATLKDVRYTRDYFPFIVYRWSKPITGYYGQGLAEQLTGIQLRINQLNHFIQKAQDLIAVPRVFVDIGSKMLRTMITDEIGAVIPYRGKPPTFMTPQAVSAEIYQYKEALWRRGYEITGIQQMSATGMKPAGLESAVALREYNDIGTGRFVVQAQRWERLIPAAAGRIIDVAKEIHGKGGSCKATFHARSLVKEICWKDVDMERDMFRMSVEAASILSATPAGRIQQVVELAQAGIVGQAESRRLLDHPDLRREMDIQNAAIEDIEATIEQLLDGEYVPPEPHQDLKMGFPRVQLAYLKAKRDGAPWEILEELTRWLESADYLMKQQMADEQAKMAQMQAEAQQRLMAQQAPPGLPAPGSTGQQAQPTSSLAPNAMMIKPTGLPS